jgi:hypothetical protein
MFTIIETPTFVRLACDCWNDEDQTPLLPSSPETQMLEMLSPDREV